MAPSLLHEGLIEPFRSQSSLAAELLGFALAPLVIGPGTVPVVVDESVAVRRPELAVLSSIVYGGGPEAVEIGKAALAAARGLDAQRAAVYIDLVLAFVNDAARGVLEALMASGSYQYQSEFARRHVAEGEARGEAKGLRDALEHVLAARVVTLSDAGRARIEACADMALLTTWLQRAATAASEAEVFAGSD